MAQASFTLPKQSWYLIVWSQNSKNWAKMNKIVQKWQFQMTFYTTMKMEVGISLNGPNKWFPPYWFLIAQHLKYPGFSILSWGFALCLPQIVPFYNHFTEWSETKHGSFHQMANFFYQTWIIENTHNHFLCIFDANVEKFWFHPSNTVVVVQVVRWPLMRYVKKETMMNIEFLFDIWR